MLARAGEIDMLCARVGRFYGDGLCWASALPFSRLMRLADLMPAVIEREPQQVIHHEHHRR